MCFEHSSGMGSVLSARVPGSLERLVFSACHLAWAGPPEDLPPEQAEALAGVQGLLIEDCSVEPGEEALGGLLRQLPALEELVRRAGAVRAGARGSTA